MTINIKDLGDIEIKHYEIQDDWEEMEFSLTEENVKALKEIEPILAENGLTVNDLMVSLLKLMVEGKDKVKEFVEYNLKQPKILGATLLSKEEVETLLTQQERTCKNWWWLRSPGYGSYCAAIVLIGGVSDYGLSVNDDRGCVRPALKIDISNSDIKVGDTFTFGGKEFKIISSELAWMYKDNIGRCAFREEWKAPNANIYEASDIKKYIDAWFAKTKTE